VNAVAEQHRQYVDQNLVDEPPPQALAGHVGAEDFDALAARTASAVATASPMSPERIRTAECRRLQPGRQIT